MSLTNKFVLSLYVHSTGDRNCTGCPESYPVECEQPGCSGFVHAEFTGLKYFGFLCGTLYCDKCDTWERKDYDDQDPSTMALTSPRDSEASRRTPTIPPAGWKGVPDTVDWAYFTFNQWEADVRFPSYYAIHVVGNRDCPNCEEKPLSTCQLPGCHGLIHSALQLEAVDETSTHTPIARRCDVCGDIGRLRGLSTEDFEAIREQHPREQTELNEAYRRRNSPNPKERFADWLEYIERFLSKQRVVYKGRGRLAEPDFPDIRWLATGFGPFLMDVTRPSWRIDTLFRDQDRLELFGVFNNEMKSRPNDVTLRAAGISLYWFLSRFCPTYEVPSVQIDDETGEYIETSESVPDYSDEWKPYRREFQGYLSRLVRLVNVQDCGDWHRTLWEIHNCCAARDWDLARKLFAHAAEQNQCLAPELTALPAYFEYRVIFGPDIDSRLGLGSDNPIEPKWHVQPYWESVGREFFLPFELSLEALAVPLDHLCSEGLRSSESRTGDTVRLEFIWGALQDKLPLLPFEQAHSLGSAIRALDEALDKLGPHQDLYRSILAQCLEVLGSNTGAAEAYRTLALRPEPFKGLRSCVLFALKAASLYMKDGETGKAEEVLASARSRYPDDIQTLQELLKLKAARGVDLHEVDSLAEKLGKLAKEEDWTLETRLFMSMHRRSTISQAAVDEELQKWPPSAGLCPSSKEAFETALQHHLGAAAGQDRRDRDLRTAAFYFSKAVECQLRKRVFEPFRVQVLNSQPRDPLINLRGVPDKFLNAYVDDEHNGITFGQMVNSMKFVRTLNTYVQKHFPRLLSSAILGNLRHLVPLRNAETHETSDPQLAARARALAESVIEAMDRT